MGVTLSLLGPSVSYLERRLDQSTAVIGVLFAVLAGANFVGALVGGRAISTLGGHQTIRIGLVGFVLGTTLLAVGRNFPTTALGAAAIGASTGAVDAAANTLVVWVRPGRSGPSLNALHFMFGVGSLLAPLATDRAVAWSGELWPAAGLVLVLAAAAMFLIGRRPSPQAAHSVTSDRPVASDRLVLVVAFFFLLYVGAEVGFSGWIHTYSEEVGFGGSLPALATAVFWAAFSLGRLIAIPISRRVHPYRIVFLSATASIVGLLTMIVFDGAAWSVWIGCAIYGLAAAPQYPTMIALVDRDLSLSARATSWIVGAAAIGGLLVPLSIGPLIDSVGATSMPIVVGAVSAVALAWVLVIGREVAKEGQASPSKI
jgi:FHS family Na+ dependent glucose MFS transporter 1